jgi:hypothetical protein
MDCGFLNVFRQRTELIEADVWLTVKANAAAEYRVLQEVPSEADSRQEIMIRYSV